MSYNIQETSLISQNDLIFYAMALRLTNGFNGSMYALDLCFHGIEGR